MQTQPGGMGTFLGHLSDNSLPSTVKDRKGSKEGSAASGWISFLFDLTESNTLSVLLFWNVLHFMYAGLWGGFLMFSVIENGLMFDFTQAFNPVYFIMQGLVLTSLYAEFKLGNVFYAMITEVRALARKIAAFHDGTKEAIQAIEQSDNTKEKNERVKLVVDSIKKMRDLLMVYTYCTFELFGISDDTDYKYYEFTDTVNMASKKFSKHRLNDEHITHILDGAEYYMLKEMANMHYRRVLSGDMTQSLISHVNNISMITAQIWTGMKPWKSEILDKLPALYLTLYKYLLVPLGTFSTVGPVWGILVYGSILFIYNSAGIVVWWLGDPFSANARHVPVDFAKIRRQQYATIADLLDPENEKLHGHLPDTKVFVYIGNDENE